MHVFLVAIITNWKTLDVIIIKTAHFLSITFKKDTITDYRETFAILNKHLK